MVNFGNLAPSTEELMAVINKIEKLEDEKTNIALYIKETFADAKGRGYNIKILKQVLKLRKMKDEDRKALEDELDIYLKALGM